MGLQKNMADMLRALKENRKETMEGWSEELGIAPSTLQDYLKGKGNPTVKMVEHLAEKLGVNPIALISGEIGPEQYEAALLILNTIRAVSDLPQPKRLKFAELFLEQVRLLEEESEQDGDGNGK